MVAHTCNPSSQEAEAGGLLTVQAQPEWHRETLSQKTKQNKKLISHPVQATLLFNQETKFEARRKDQNFDLIFLFGWDTQSQRDLWNCSQRIQNLRNFQVCGLSLDFNLWLSVKMCLNLPDRNNPQAWGIYRQGNTEILN